MSSKNSSTYALMIQKFREEADSSLAEYSSRYFKTGEDEYGEGDQFLGIRVPVIRSYAKQYRNIELFLAQKLLRSEYHEERLLGLLILVEKFNAGDEFLQHEIFKLYLEHTKFINNWDLVDSSAPHIVGKWLELRDKQILFELAKSKSLWERRIAITSTLYLIRQNKFCTTLQISEILLDDSEDLIHKAVGWMLREIGKRNLAKEEEFLQQHSPNMPRTMLRYAIEKFPEDRRKAYLKR